MRRLVTLLAFLLFASTAQAAPASPASIDALLRVTKAESLMDGMFANIEPVMRQSMARAIQGQPVTAEQQRLLDAMPATLAKVLRDEMSWDKMRPLYVQIYQESFSQDEIDGLLAFYESPAGQAFVAKMPVVMQKSMTVMQARMGPLMDRMRAAMQDAVAEARKTPP